MANYQSSASSVIRSSNFFKKSSQRNGTVMMSWILIVLLVGIAKSDPYVPGTPGAPWSEEEILIVKAKLYSIFSNGGGFMALNQIHPGNSANWMDIPNAAKMLRLGFHDCLKYTDGSGGCDGCLNWEGVGFRHTEASKFAYSNVGATNNNGLGYTVEVLEGIYTDPTFPLNLAVPLPVSLKDSGKSRADLWALAAIAAVEYGIETNNMVCDGTFNNNPGVQCNEDLGTSECHVNLATGIQFQTGRRDCTEFGDQPYKATKEESHPNAVGNGPMTVEFFKNDFGLTGRETVALLGAHTMGRLHFDVSLFRYVWTSRGTHMFNNHYYRNIVRADRDFYDDNECTKVTDAEGNKPKTRWTVHTRKDTYNGGPVHWIHENYVCPNCVRLPDHACCKDVPEGSFCKADSVDMADDNNINGGCERYTFVSGIDEMALPCEMGLYFDFDVTEDGIPYGCPGLEVFDSAHLNISYLNMWSTIPNPNNPNKRIKADPDCPLQTLEEPTGSGPLHQAFDDFASSQSLWTGEFVPVFEKMLANGYQEGELTDAPSQFDDVVCPRGKSWEGNFYYNCYHQSALDNGAKFVVVSQLDGRALEANGPTDNKGKMMPLDESNPNQQWIQTDVGSQWINVGTGLPLELWGNAKSFLLPLDDQARILDARNPERAVDRGWTQQDGVIVGSWWKHGGLNQKWTVQFLN